MLVVVVPADAPVPGARVALPCGLHEDEVEAFQLVPPALTLEGDQVERPREGSGGELVGDDAHAQGAQPPTADGGVVVPAGGALVGGAYGPRELRPGPLADAPQSPRATEVCAGVRVGGELGEHGGEGGGVPGRDEAGPVTVGTREVAVGGDVREHHRLGRPHRLQRLEGGDHLGDRLREARAGHDVEQAEQPGHLGAGEPAQQPYAVTEVEALHLLPQGVGGRTGARDDDLALDAVLAQPCRGVDEDVEPLVGHQAPGETDHGYVGPDAVPRRIGGVLGQGNHVMRVDGVGGEGDELGGNAATDQLLPRLGRDGEHRVGLGGDECLEVGLEAVPLRPLPARLGRGLGDLPETAHLVDERHAESPGRDERGQADLVVGRGVDDGGPVEPGLADERVGTLEHPVVEG